MNDVVVVKTAHNVHDRVDLADVGQELVASPSPRDAPLTRPAMSTNSMVAGVTFFGWYICQRLQAAVRHVHDSHIGFNGAKGVICGLRARICNGVKQRALPTFGRPTIPIFILLPHQPSNRRTASFVGLVIDIRMGSAQLLKTPPRAVRVRKNAEHGRAAARHADAVGAGVEQVVIRPFDLRHWAAAYS